MNESSSYAPDYNNTAKLSLTVTEDMHGKTYVCRGRGTHGYDVQKHYIIIVNGKKSHNYGKYGICYWNANI